ncbi:MAG: HpsJ family protein [Leptolyngbyaceae cyanobacterium bins.349]|nr:HpsJ family protein [Leptolyngbyaceae cyanobacterium bins.349]
MNTLPVQNLTGSYSGKTLCRLVGFACLAGFLVDLLVLTFPPTFGNIEWRIGFLRQLSDRSIILLFGLALVMFGILEFRVWRRRLAVACLVLGVLFNLSCILVIRDSLTFQQQALSTISNQASQAQTRIQQAQKDPNIAPNITPQQLEQAAQAVSSQATSLKQNAKTNVLKSSVASVGNLIVVGLALIGLGQYGARPPKA